MDRTHKVVDLYTVRNLGLRIFRKRVLSFIIPPVCLLYRLDESKEKLTMKLKSTIITWLSQCVSDIAGYTLSLKVGETESRVGAI